MSWPDDGVPGFPFAVAIGNVPGYAAVRGVGFNPSVDTGTIPEDIWGGAGLFNWIDTPTALQVRSTSASDAAAGVGAQTVRFTTLVGDYAMLDQIVTLNGVTPVPIPTNCIAINGGRCLTAGSSGTNVGDLIVEDVAGATVRAIILAGKGATRQCPYTVPAGKTLVVPWLLLGVDSPTGAIGKYATIETYFKPVTGGGAAYSPLRLGNTNGQPYNLFVDPPVVIPERTRFSLRVASVSDNNTAITGAWNGILKTN